MASNRVVIVGAGVGGLTAGALMSKAGLDVTVLEAHVYGGGCAGTFYHQGYRFDAGATLAAGFDAGGGMTRLGETLGISWPVEAAESAMRVYLPGGESITRWTDARRWHDERQRVFGEGGEPFWRWQEQTADRLWDVALKGVPWPPQSARELGDLAGTGLEWVLSAPLHMLGIGIDAVRPVAARLNGASAVLRQYVDGQLLIAAQATSAQANALYGAAALDMPRRGVAHVRGGIGRLADELAGAVRAGGGEVRYRQKVERVTRTAAGTWAIRTNRQAEVESDAVVFNLPPWDAAALLGEHAPMKLRRAMPPADARGAFMLYVGIEGSAVPANTPLHHQVLVSEPFGEGNSVFLSLSLPGDDRRAPAGHRALTLSTHTDLRSWWQLFEHDREAYEARKEAYTERVLAAAERALPGVQSSAKLVLPGTPVTFQRFTHRSLGWVGGFPQTSLFRAWGTHLEDGLWLVGDSIFPGQSVLATALGGARVAGAVIGSARKQRRNHTRR